MKTVPQTSRLKTRWLPAIWLSIWFVALSIPSAYLMAKHMVALPTANPQPAEEGGWRAWHVVSVDCPCSRSVTEELLSRQPLEGWTECVTLLGTDEKLAEALLNAGYVVQTGDTEAQVAEAGIQGAPWLVAFAPTGEVKYSGGYADLRPGPGVTLSDALILTSVRQGETPASKPAYGCATSRVWQERLDPLRLKSATQRLSVQP